MRKCIFHLMGGLGNQLFQYACAYTVSKSNNCDIYFNVENYQKDFRELRLNEFCIDGIKTDNSWSNYEKIIYRITNKIGNKELQHLFGLHLQKGMTFTNIELGNIDNQRFIGYWQNEKYFKAYKNDIKEMFEVKTELDPQSQLLYSNICNTESVCVHFRRGDYLKYSDIYANCTKHYYEEGIYYLERRINNVLFFVFSDDIGYAKEHWPKEIQNVVFCEGNRPDIVEFKLMYMCKHYIIANSTFSWWAAYLGKSENKIIIAPEHFFVKERTEYPMEWVTLPNA